jgi:hypothetical protein
MFAPLSVYPVVGTLMALPMPIDGQAQEYLESLISRKLLNRPRFVLVNIRAAIETGWPPVPDLPGEAHQLSSEPVLIVYEKMAALPAPRGTSVLNPPATEFLRPRRDRLA